MSLPNLDPSDRRFWPKDPEVGFSPEHNKRVINGTIEKNEKLRKRIRTQYKEQVRERTDAVARFLKKKDWGFSGGIEKYLGRRNLAALRGEDIITKIQHAKRQQKGS